MHVASVVSSLRAMRVIAAIGAVVRACATKTTSAPPPPPCDQPCHDPPVEYDATCPMMLARDGNALTGEVCGRAANTTL